MIHFDTIGLVGTDGIMRRRTLVFRYTEKTSASSGIFWDGNSVGERRSIDGTGTNEDAKNKIAQSFNA